ncbi:hypothetical protein BV898_14725 [Hypsibius exemplaris]|uniref:Uncharacterized protein n=1 Tax=Hypsibius exemplaris TaxID=2072580 RepID=A0A9X6N9W7_HYPEX|nr:hypothetical protein BV898_14725 [Hypsibius exemplaris]
MSLGHEGDFDDLLTIQRAILTLTGFMPANNPPPTNPSRKVWPTLPTVAAVSFIIGSLYPAVMNTAQAIYGIFCAAASTSSSGAGNVAVVAFMEEMPYTFVSVRAFLVLAIFWRNRRTWAGVIREACELFRLTSYQQPQQRSHCRRRSDTQWVKL